MDKWIKGRKKHIEAQQVHNRYYAEFEMQYIQAIEKREALIEKKDEALKYTIAPLTSGLFVADDAKGALEKVEQTLALTPEDMGGRMRMLERENKELRERMINIGKMTEVAKELVAILDK